VTQPAVWTPLLEQLLAGEALSALQAAQLMQGWLAETIDRLLMYNAHNQSFHLKIL